MALNYGELTVVTGRGYLSTYKDYYWDSNYPLSYLLGYFVCTVLFSTLLWLSSRIIWYWSLFPLKEFANLFLTTQKLYIKPAPLLEILNAIYKTDNNQVDVTQQLIERVVDNTLAVKATNELAGDPHPGVVKKLVVKYRYDNKISELKVNEGEILKLPQ